MWVGLFLQGNPTPSFLIRGSPDLRGQGRGFGEEAGVATLNDGFLLGLGELCCVSGGLPKPNCLPRAGQPGRREDGRGGESAGKGGRGDKQAGTQQTPAG